MVHTDSNNAVVTYHNPLDNVADLARIFFGAHFTCFTSTKVHILMQLAEA